MCVCLFVCPIITHETLDQFASSFDWGTKENHGNFLDWFSDSKLSGSSFIGKNS